ncbi:MAG: D-glycerate dehydrogenase [Anaerolineaceae bacterium]|nr:D-glycerate dehydrogenase [Anaerolineaceae bacterium]
MAKPRIFITRPIPSAGIDLLQDHCEVDVFPGPAPPRRAELLAGVAKADAILPLLTERIDEEVLRAGPQLRVIANMAVGYDNIDVAAATARGIPVGNTPGVLTETSADLAFALLLAAARHIVPGADYVRAGRWQTWEPQLFLGQDVHGATLGIVGLGRIGQAVARRARGFGMRILFHGGSDQTAAEALGARRVPFAELLQQSDFVSVHTPLNAETHHLIDAAALQRMKPTAILVNTARGAVVDPVALYEALSSGQIAAAALDVTEPEPPATDDPLLGLANCLVIPHLGSASVATRAKMAAMAAENALAGLRGERLPHCVNEAVYEASD